MCGASFFLENVIHIWWISLKISKMDNVVCVAWAWWLPRVVPSAASVKDLNASDFSVLFVVTWKSFGGRGLLLPPALLVPFGICMASQACAQATGFHAGLQ